MKDSPSSDGETSRGTERSGRAEGLETSREELQSLNEELSRVNQELKSKVDDLSRANSDLSNLMAATGVATIFLDRKLAITRYTPSAVTLFRLIASDVGRPLTDLSHQLNYPELKEDAARVLETLAPVKREVSDGERWFLSRLLPYRTDEDRIAGVVLTFVDITEAREADVTIRASEQRLRTLADAVPQLIWSNDSEGKANYFNLRWFEYTGLSPQESIGPGWQAIVHPEDEIVSKELWRNAQAEGRTFDTEYRLRGADGNYRWFIGRNVPVYNRNGKLEGWVGTATDIQESKEAQAAIQASEEQFRLAIEDAPIPVIIYADDGQILQVSRMWTELTGYAREDIPNVDALLNRAYRTKADAARRHLERLFEEQSRLLGKEIEITSSTGETRCWAVSASAPGKLRDGRRFIVGMALDITERKQLEETLLQTQEQKRLIVENAREYAIVSLDLERRITSWNVGAEAMLGYKEEDILGQCGDVIFTKEDNANGAPELEAATALREGRAEDERWHVRKDQTRFWGSGSMMAMRDHNGKPIGFVKIFRDDSERRNARLSLERSRKDLQAAFEAAEKARYEAESANQAKDRFLAVISHELRTPLSPVLMAVRTLGRRSNLPADVADALEMIERNISLEVHFIDELLDVTRIASGKMEIFREPVDLHQTIEDAVNVVRPALQAKEQHLSVTLHADSQQVVGDATRLQQVFWNLLQNASKFTPQGGRIEIRSANVLSSAGSPQCIRVEVIDKGVGFSAEASERIFGAFVQADEGITREYGGLGLGLAISKAIIEAHGGTLKAASPGPGQGATFTVEVPFLPG